MAVSCLLEATVVRDTAEKHFYSWQDKTKQLVAC